MEIENIPLSRGIITRLKEFELNMEEYFVLVAKFARYKWLQYYPISSSLYKSLIDKGFLTETRLLSKDGRIKMIYILGLMENEEIKKLVKDFDEFWDKYPKSDAHGKFPRTRNFRVNRDACLQIYLNLRKKYSKEIILEGLEADVSERKRNSIYENRLTFMPNPRRWLEEKRFLTFVDSKDSSDQKVVKKDVI